MVSRIPIEPTYKKDNGIWHLNPDSLPLPGHFTLKERSIVYIPPKQYGGNHRHPRTEVFVGIGDDLLIIWEDQDGQRHREKMMDDDHMSLFYVEPFTPHVVINEGSSFAMLIELADDRQHDVERVNLLD